MTTDLLRRDVRTLDELLGSVISELQGPSALELVRKVRRLAYERRQGSHTAEAELSELIVGCSLDDFRILTRSLGIYFDLVNIAEERQRVRVLRERERLGHPAPLSESIPAAIARLKAAGKTPEEVQAALNALSIELVFTAHPSEAKRRSIRAKLRRMRFSLQELDRDELLPRERRRLQDQMRSELAVLWQTDFLRPVRPTVLEEVERGLAVMPRLWETVPQVYQAIRKSLLETYPEAEFEIPVFLRFGSWMGGDRDGNPHVTADVTASTLCRLRQVAIVHHLSACERMYDFLTISSRLAGASERLRERLAAAVQKWPELEQAFTRVSEHEIYRRWIRMIQWRLQQSRMIDLSAPAAPGDYGSGEEFEADVRTLGECLTADHEGRFVEHELRKWHDQVRVFGLHLLRLDIRQDARRYQEITGDWLRAAGITNDYEAADEPQRIAAIETALSEHRTVDSESLQPLTQDTLRLYEVLHTAIVRLGPQCLGGNIISLTRSASDVLSVLRLWQGAKQAAALKGEVVAAHDLRIIPLFEKIGDLHRSPQTLGEFLDHPAYRAYLERQDNRQIVMVGYSDSTKDGGYLAACWGLFTAQAGIEAAAAKRGVRVTFFHGRGGSLGRGGGPAARGILSLPSEALDGTLRLTEQGEVLAERYDDVQIAYRHLEQVTWATLLGSTVIRSQPQQEWLDLTASLAARSWEAYRELVDQPGFMPYFVQTTPIEVIEDLPIGSRPSRRRGERSLDDLRAIPWVFSLTQNRSLIPAWYGLGTALTEIKYRDRKAWQTVCEMYRQWIFFQATIDNAALALAKADMYVSQRYAELAESDDLRDRIWLRIATERDRARQAILDLTGQRELLAGIPWFQDSIEARNPTIDPLNLIQIELMRRRSLAEGEQSEYVRHLLRLTVQGIASGMRTTG